MKRTHCILGSSVGAVVRALAFHQFVPGSIPGPGVICGLSLLVLYSAPRGFSPGTLVFPSTQKPTFNLIWLGVFDLFDLMMSFDLFRLQSPQLVDQSCSARMNWTAAASFNSALCTDFALKLPIRVDQSPGLWTQPTETKLFAKLKILPVHIKW